MDIKKLISEMTLEEKIGQLCVPILQKGEITEDLKTWVIDKHVGMIRYCPNAEFDNASEVVGEPNRYFSPGEMAEFLNEIQSMAKIPLFIAVDQEGSTRNDVNRAGALAYSGHMSFGAANDEELTYKIAKAAGEEFRAMGINLVQAPIIDVLRYEGRQTMKAATFGESVERVTAHALAMMKGYQDGGVASMAKHFPGYGSVATDAHKGVAEIFKDFDALDSEDIAPLKTLFANGVNGVMTGHVLTHCIDSEHPATLSRKMIKGYLREKLGFDGIVETDAMRMHAIQDKYGTGPASVMAIQAGCDLVLLRGSMEHFEEGYNALLNAARNGELNMEDVDESLRRVLEQKEKIGLLDNPMSDPDKANAIVGCDEHKALANELAEKSITAFKTKDLPLAVDGKKVACISVEPQKIGAAMDAVQSIDMLINAVSATYENTEGLMTKLNPTEDDIKAAVELAKNSDVVILGLCNAIIYSNQEDLAKAVYEANNNVIVVAMDSPYDVELVPYIDNFVATYGVAAASMYAAVDVIAGKKEGKAICPVTIKKL